MLTLTLALALSAAPAPTVDELRALIRPTEAELKYQEVPWRSTMEEAVNEARAANKPLLVWIMNGHPLAGV